MNRVLTAFALALGTASGIAGAQTLVPFSDAKLPFSFSYPQGWHGLSAGAGGNIQGIMMISATKPPASVAKLLYTSRSAKDSADMAAQLDGFEKGSRSTGATVQRQSRYAATYGGIRGYEGEYLISQGKQAIKLRVWFGAGRKNLYSFQLSDTPARYAAASSLFSKVLATVKFR